MKRRHRAVLLIGVLAAIAMIGLACGDDENGGGSEIPSVAITGSDFTYDAPTQIAGGLTRIDFTNAAPAEDHQAQLLRLNEDVTYTDFTEVLTAEDSTEADIFALVAAAEGGPGTGPGGETNNVIDLAEGTYALICFIPSPTDGVPHFAKGMVQQLDVTAPAEEQPEPPETDLTVGLSDFEFEAPQTLEAGETSFDVVNNGPQPHEMAVYRLEEGITTDDALGILSGEVTPEGPPPFSFAGQVAVLSPSESGVITMDLEAATYSLLCFVTDPASGMPHFALGMAQDLVVE